MDAAKDEAADGPEDDSTLDLEELDGADELELVAVDAEMATEATRDKVTSVRARAVVFVDVRHFAFFVF